MEEVPQIDKLHSFLKEILGSEGHSGGGSVRFEFDGDDGQDMEATVDKYGAMLDEEMNKIHEAVSSTQKLSFDEMTVFRGSMTKQVESALQQMVDILRKRFDMAASLKVKDLEEDLNKALMKEADVNKSLSSALSKKKGTLPKQKEESRENLLEAIEALEEERDVLKKQVENLKMQARNSKRVATVHTYQDESKHKEEIQNLKAKLAESNSALLELDMGSSGNGLKLMLKEKEAALEDIQKDRKNLLDLFQKANARNNTLKTKNEEQAKHLEKLIGTIKSLTNTQQALADRVHELEEENEVLDLQLSQAKRRVEELTEHSNSVLRKRLLEAEARKKSELEALDQENERLRRLLSEERQRSISYDEDSLRQKEMLSSMLDDVLTNVELERNQIRMQMAHDSINNL